MVWMCAVRWGHTSSGEAAVTRAAPEPPPLSDQCEDPQDQLDSPDQSQKLHNFKLPMHYQKWPMVYEVPFAGLGTGHRLPGVPGVFVTTACSVTVPGVFECKVLGVSAQ